MRKSDTAFTRLPHWNDHSGFHPAASPFSRARAFSNPEHLIQGILKKTHHFVRLLSQRTENQVGSSLILKLADSTCYSTLIRTSRRAIGVWNDLP